MTTEKAPDSLMDRYGQMEGAEEAKQDAELPPLARQREMEAKERAHTLFNAARDLISKGMLAAVGYRVLLKPVEATMGLEAAEAEVAPTLAESGFVAKTGKQKEREDRGSPHGVVIDIGPVAFARHGGRAVWCDEGDMVVFMRYAGCRIEHPPGSDIWYQVVNDEDIFGKIS